MEYQNTITGIFLKRPNRFIAHVLIDGKEEIVHVKNTGRCKELLLEGAKVILEEGKNPKRKTRYSIIAVYKGDVLVNMDSQAPNEAVAEAISKGKIKEVGEVSFLKREVGFGASRFDIYYEKGAIKGFVEVKGVTLEQDGLAMFPDAPTERGTKHLLELIRATEAGFEATVLFVVQMKGVHSFCPNQAMDAKFSEAVKKAIEAGVSVLVYDCDVTESSMEISSPILQILVE